MSTKTHANSAARFIALLCICIVAAACSPIMAATQPGKKDLKVLQVGTPRSAVVGELGYPLLTEEDIEAHHCHETYAFTQGYSIPARAGRTLFHLGADVFTFALWEIIGTPIELYNDGTEVSLEVLYDENDRVDSVCIFSGAEAVKTGRIVTEAEIEKRLHDEKAPSPRNIDDAEDLPAGDSEINEESGNGFEVKE